MLWQQRRTARPLECNKKGSSPKEGTKDRPCATVTFGWAGRHQTLRGDKIRGPRDVGAPSNASADQQSSNARQIHACATDPHEILGTAMQKPGGRPTYCSRPSPGATAPAALHADPQRRRRRRCRGTSSFSWLQVQWKRHAAARCRLCTLYRPSYRSPEPLPCYCCSRRRRQGTAPRCC